MNKPLHSSRARVWTLLEVAEAGDRPSWLVDIGIRALIALNILVVVIETVPSVDEAVGPWLRLFDLFSVGVFSIEYLLRVWSCTTDARYSSAVRGRLRFMRSPLAIIDLLAVLPFWLPVFGADLRVLRGIRLLRLFRILKIARYSRALRTFGRVFRSKTEELVVTLVLCAIIVLIASSLLYYVENAAQPEVFSSVPAAMWWGIVTLTTVGYGDVYPITTFGRVLGGIFALTGVLLIALPTAILGAAFAAEMASQRLEGEGGALPRTCPHCGESLEE